MITKFVGDDEEAAAILKQMGGSQGIDAADAANDPRSVLGRLVDALVGYMGITACKGNVMLPDLLKRLQSRLKADFNEADHPRADDGKFGETEGGDNSNDDDMEDNDDLEKTMSWDQIKDILTHGGCGILAQELLDALPGSEPVLWKDNEGYPVHAAVLYDGRLIHFGDREEGYEPATREELDEAVENDFDSSRHGEDKVRDLAKKVAAKIVEENGF